MRVVFLIAVVALLTACGSTNGIPSGAVAYCGNFEYTGTFTKSETAGRALGVSNAASIERMSVDDVIKLAESMGCNQ